MTKIPLLAVVGAILILSGVILYAVNANATVTTFIATYACSSSLVQGALHNSSVTSNSTYAAVLAPCTNAANMQYIGIFLIIIGVALLAAQYYSGRGRKRR
ncbi:hypothetical protein M1589_00690 [Candidatus Marsarchaeota archaeon]|jgi:uncharacterized membrane protein|nr:hypothetical protein [Candidatus Marsarchaeota archaeon]MCL5115385.1 hypothetical protein [Candidatus Marsarchaeota archaeon]